MNNCKHQIYCYCLQSFCTVPIIYVWHKLAWSVSMKKQRNKNYVSGVFQLPSPGFLLETMCFICSTCLVGCHYLWMLWKNVFIIILLVKALPEQRLVLMEPTICPCYLQLTFASAIPSWSIPLHVRSSPWLHYSSSRHNLLCRSLHDAIRHRAQPPPLLLQNECQTGRWIYCIVMFWVLRTNILGVLEIDICHGKHNDTLETTFKLYRQHCNIFKNYKSMCSRFNNIV